MENHLFEEKVLEKVVKNIPLGVVVTREGRCRKIYYVNRFAYELLGYSRQEYIESVEESWAEFLGIDIKQIIRDNNEKIRSGESFELLSKTQTKSGEEKWLLCQVVVKMAEGPLCYISYQDVTEWVNQEQVRYKERQALREQASRDSFTKLLNRGTMEHLVGEALDADSDSKEYAYITLDVDDFKHINDVYGHGRGDMLILKVADLLTEFFKEETFVGRMGGDEFAVFCKNVENRDTIYQQAQHVMERLRREQEELGLKEAPTVSIGIAFGPEAGTSFLELYRRADEALYRVKNEQKNGIAVYAFS